MSRILTGFLVISGCITVAAYFMLGSKEEQEEEVIFHEQTSELPDNFYNPFPKIEEPVFIAEPAPVQKLKADDAFSYKPRIKRQDPNRNMRWKIENKRRKGGAVKVIGQDDVRGFEIEGRRFWVDENKADDYAEHGLAKSIPTYPVDLSRTLTVDRFLPAVLITEIKSELSSDKVIAQIEADVYASHGRKILIPKGSKAIGGYETLQGRGDTRVQILWDRIITPNGINVSFTSETADALGASGVTGEIDNRYKDRYAEALLVSTVMAGASYSVDVGDPRQVNAAEAFTREFGTVTTELIRDSLDLEPRVNIKRGTRVFISPLEDIWFKEPKGGRIEVVKLDQ